VSTGTVVAVPETRTYFRPWLTQVLVGANVLVYVAMVLMSRSAMGFRNADLINWGANFAPFTLSGQGWRVWTSTYVHGGLIHILFNMWCLWNLGALAERILGRWTYFAVYTACGIAGSLLSLLVSTWWSPFRISVGASGAIFGLAGALIAAIYLGKLPFPKEALRGISRSLVSFAGYNLLFGFLPGIDNSAHVGGLLMGLILGAVLGPYPHSLARRT
jgi:rhomboid protease GluP